MLGIVRKKTLEEVVESANAVGEEKDEQLIDAQTATVQAQREVAEAQRVTEESKRDMAEAQAEAEKAREDRTEALQELHRVEAMHSTWVRTGTIYKRTAQELTTLFRGVVEASIRVEEDETKFVIYAKRPLVPTEINRLQAELQLTVDLT